MKAEIKPKCSTAFVFLLFCLLESGVLTFWLKISLHQVLMKVNTKPKCSTVFALLLFCIYLLV